MTTMTEKELLKSGKSIAPKGSTAGFSGVVPARRPHRRPYARGNRAEYVMALLTSKIIEAEGGYLHETL